MPLPSFLIVGAAKAGTTSLYAYLKQHPQVCMSEPKETNYFCEFTTDFHGPGDDEFVNRHKIMSRTAYEAAFTCGPQHRAIGEASPAYLYYHERVIPRIRALVPNVRIVIILRNPVDRALSSYLHTVRDGRETCSFERALQLEDERVTKNWEHLWHHVRVGFYSAQVRAYRESFSTGAVKIYLYEDLLADPVALMRDLYEFVGVNPGFVPEVHQWYNQSQVIRSELVRRFVDNPRHILRRLLRPLFFMAGDRFERVLLERLHNRNEMTMRWLTRRRLVSLYRTDILELQNCIGRDLRIWMET